MITNLITKFGRTLFKALVIVAAAVPILIWWKPLVSAFIAATLLEPVVRRFSRYGWMREVSVTVLFAVAVVVVGGLAAVLIRESQDMLNEMSRALSAPGLFASLSDRFPGIAKIAATLGLDDANAAIHGELRRAEGFLVNLFGQLAVEAPNAILRIFIFAFALYYFVVDKKSLRTTVLLLLEPHEIAELVKITRRVAGQSSVVGLIQAATLTLASIIFNAGKVPLVFAVAFLCSFIPVLGTSPVSITLVWLTLVDGRVESAVGISVFALISGFIDNLLRPYIVRGQAHPLLSFLAIIGGIYVFGIIGLFLGPILLELAYSFGETGANIPRNGPQINGTKDAMIS